MRGRLETIMPGARTPPREVMSPARHYADTQKKEDSQSFISTLCSSISRGVHFAEPVSSSRAEEINLVRGITQMLQGFSCSYFIWDGRKNCFSVRSGIFLSHLSETSLKGILDQFLCCATSLKLVELFVKKVESLKNSFPTLEAFASSVSSWLKRLRNRALFEEVNSSTLDSERNATLLGLTNSLSSICSGGEHLLQVVEGAVPRDFLYTEANVLAADLSVLILDYLYKRLAEVSPVLGGEEEAYHMLIFIFIGSLLPYLTGLNSWIFYGILDDPYEEMFFYENSSVAIDQPAFWDQSYLLRSWSVKSFPDTFVRSLDKEDIPQGNDHNDLTAVSCPMFLKNMAMGIISAGKSLKLVQFLDNESHSKFGKEKYPKKRNFFGSKSSDPHSESECLGSFKSNDGSEFYLKNMLHAQNIGSLTLLEMFLVSFVGLVCDGDHVFDDIITLCSSFSEILDTADVDFNTGKLPPKLDCEKKWGKFFVDTITHKYRKLCIPKDPPTVQPFYPENPAVTVCGDLVDESSAFREELNISRSFYLPSLDDETLRGAIFDMDGDLDNSRQSGTDYAFGFKYNASEHLHFIADMESLQSLYPFPTVLPHGVDVLSMSEIMPFQEDSTLASRILSWFQNVDLKASPLPFVIIQSCLQVFIRKQVDHGGKQILLKLMNDWRLMDELKVLRAIYLCGSGDILQQFLMSIFGKLERGESCDDDFELNTILQDSIRNSADASILCCPDSLSIAVAVKDEVYGNEGYVTELISTPQNIQNLRIGANDLDFLKFTYKVPWPLDLIVNAEAIERYSQVMRFLLRVKHAKFVLDKARMWMWKRKSCMTRNQKRQLLVEQKLLHFVDAFHQYVMDRVFHTAWIELCSNMALAGSLDEVIAVHEAYLSSVQRQCFVAPDKLWALISSRIKVILGLAFDFYSVQRTLQTAAAAPAIKTRCEMEVDRIEKQFDDCISFLLRILSFKLNVGQFPHLIDLVTRINYNHFYMSSNGNLLTQPSFELASKVGRAHHSRAD